MLGMSPSFYNMCICSFPLVPIYCAPIFSEILRFFLYCAPDFWNPPILQLRERLVLNLFVLQNLNTSGTTGTPKVNHPSFWLFFAPTGKYFFLVQLHISNLWCWTSIFSQGAVISHENLIANVAGSNLNIKFYPSDVWVFHIGNLSRSFKINCFCLHNLSNSYQPLTFLTIALWIALLRYISYLPLAHIYERVNQVALLHCGVAVGFYQGVCRFKAI